MGTWKHKLNISDVFRNNEVDLAHKTEIIVGRIKKSSWYEEANYNGELENLLEELTDAGKEDNVEWWDSVWNGFYDIADDEKIWVGTL